MRWCAGAVLVASLERGGRDRRLELPHEQHRRVVRLAPDARREAGQRRADRGRVVGVLDEAEHRDLQVVLDRPLLGRQGQTAACEDGQHVAVAVAAQRPERRIIAPLARVVRTVGLPERGELRRRRVEPLLLGLFELVKPCSRYSCCAPSLGRLRGLQCLQTLFECPDLVHRHDRAGHAADRRGPPRLDGPGLRALEGL